MPEGLRKSAYRYAPGERYAPQKGKYSYDTSRRDYLVPLGAGASAGRSFVASQCEANDLSQKVGGKRKFASEKIPRELCTEAYDKINFSTSAAPKPILCQPH